MSNTNSVILRGGPLDGWDLNPKPLNNRFTITMFYPYAVVYDHGEFVGWVDGEDNPCEPPNPKMNEPEVWKGGLVFDASDVDWSTLEFVSPAEEADRV